MVGTKKSLGQHWLKNREILDQIADIALGCASGHSVPFGYAPGRSGQVLRPAGHTVPTSTPLCLEIGPGLGTLTSSLLRRFDKVIAVEYDERLATNLPKSFPGKNLEVINADILDFDFSTIPEKYVIAGNIPYYITSPILEKVLSAEHLAEGIVLLMQKEVAERILSEKETMLSLFVKNRAEVVAGPVVDRDEFTPPPKVDSQVLVLKPHAPEVSEEVLALARRGFAAPRKKLLHNLAGLKSKEELVRIFGELEIDLDARPGDLSLKQWQKLFLVI